jgi:hypothetical protein
MKPDLIPSLCIEVPVSSQQSKPLCICMFGTSTFAFCFYRLYFGIIPSVEFVFHFIAAIVQLSRDQTSMEQGSPNSYKSNLKGGSGRAETALYPSGPIRFC